MTCTWSYNLAFSHQNVVVKTGSEGRHCWDEPPAVPKTLLDLVLAPGPLTALLVFPTVTALIPWDPDF